jgi:Zn-dependent membrane protease YugP
VSERVQWGILDKITIIMHENRHEKAKKKVQAKKTLLVLTIIFSFTSMILLILGFLLPMVAFWFIIAVLSMALTLGIVYVALMGLPSAVLSKEWEETELEIEINKQYRSKRRSQLDSAALSEDDRLELKELERLKRKWGEGEELV